MSLESKIDELIAALNANTAAHGGAASTSKAADDKPASTGRGRGAGKAADKAADKPKFTAEDVRSAAVALKEKMGSKVAKDLIKKHGADQLADLEEAVYADFIAEAGKLLKGEDGEDGEDGL